MGDIGEAVPVHVGVLEPEIVETRREPEFHPMPVRQDISVLPADEPSRVKLGWYIYEYIGFEIYKITSEIRGIAKLHQTLDEEKTPLEVFSRREDLCAGMEVLFKCAFSSGYGVGIIVREDDGSLIVDMGGNIGMLDFDGDERHCWVCTGVINKRCLDKVTISS